MEESEDVSDIFTKVESGNIFPQEDESQWIRLFNYLRFS
jgi:hypothetical protein